MTAELQHPGLSLRRGAEYSGDVAVYPELQIAATAFVRQHLIGHHDADGLFITFLAQRRLEDRHRGLLLLFGHVAKRYAAAFYERGGEVGPVRCLQLIVEVEAHLLALGVVQRLEERLGRRDYLGRRITAPLRVCGLPARSGGGLLLGALPTLGTLLFLGTATP